MKNKSAIIVGGGVNGLSSAYFLQKKGFDVTVIDRGTIDNNCSFGNMGYVSPSHFMPLASPGIVAEGLSYMLSSKSPFYMKPRLNLAFLKWALTFYRSSNPVTANKNSGPLEALLTLSRKLTDNIRDDIGDIFDMEAKGIMMLCRTKETFEKQTKLAETGKKRYNLETVAIERNDLKEYEPDVEMDVYGAVLYKDDGHVHPGKYMKALEKWLIEKGVQFQLNTEVVGFEKEHNKVTLVKTDQGDFSGDFVILTPGSWLGELTKKLGHRVLIEGGKGYSTTYDYVEKNIRYPGILVEAHCAVTPWKHMLRIGGTMELSGLNDRVLINRMWGIYNSVKQFYPGLQVDFPPREKIWTGLRPVSPDGLAYIGKLGEYENVVVSDGQAMVGVASSAGSGRLVSEIVNGDKTSIPTEAFAVNRFGL